MPRLAMPLLLQRNRQCEKEIARESMVIPREAADISAFPAAKVNES